MRLERAGWGGSWGVGMGVELALRLAWASLVLGLQTQSLDAQAHWPC